MFLQVEIRSRGCVECSCEYFNVCQRKFVSWVNSAKHVLDSIDQSFLAMCRNNNDSQIWYCIYMLAGCKGDYLTWAALSFVWRNSYIVSIASSQQTYFWGRLQSNVILWFQINITWIYIVRQRVVAFPISWKWNQKPFMQSQNHIFDNERICIIETKFVLHFIYNTLDGMEISWHSRVRWCSEALWYYILHTDIRFRDIGLHVDIVSW